jgi:hypothetical protein
MNPLIQLKTTASLIRNSISRAPLRRGLFLVPLVLACFALSPEAQAVVPAPDGGYPNGNTAEGTNALFNLTTGSFNTALGALALFSDTTGSNNTATGYLALKNNTASHNTANGYQALFQNKTGVFNTAVGEQALFQNTTGNYNTAIGFEALFSNKTIRDVSGGANTATGFKALFSNSIGLQNTATGSEALFTNRTGFRNTANGVEALFSNTEGQQNTATGVAALFSNTTGDFNTATGDTALFSNTTGESNTATGFQALENNTIGLRNTATGANALLNNKTGNYNTATGVQALESNTSGLGNTANGYQALLNNTGHGNIALGVAAGHDLTSGDYNIDIGNNGVAGESNTLRIGRSGVLQNAYIQGISGVTVPSGVTVIVGSDGHLGTIVSSARFKDEIKPIGKASEAILALKPVTFCYKKELDPDGIPQFGLVAEEVAKVNPDLVARDADGKPYTVRYEAVNAMLINEFIKAHRKTEEQQKEIDVLKAELKEQRSLLQNVSDRLELKRSMPQVAANDQ